MPFGPRAFAASVPTPDAAMVEYQEIRVKNLNVYFLCRAELQIFLKSLQNTNSVGGMTFYIVGGEGPVTDEVWK